MIDCFPFLNELDLLEVRLNELAPYVDYFVLAESTQTHSGKPKPLFYEENKERFSEFNILHVIVPEMDGQPWEREAWGRQCLLDSIKIGEPEEIVLISDLDEIPNLIDYNGKEGVFKQQPYTYYFNCKVNHEWKGTFAVKRKHIGQFCIDHVLRQEYKRTAPIVGSGWHFTSLGSLDQIKYKVESFAHQELNKDSFKNRIADSVDQLKDWICLHNKPVQFSKKMPTGPQWLLDNRERYPHLWI